MVTVVDSSVQNRVEIGTATSTSMSGSFMNYNMTSGGRQPDRGGEPRYPGPDNMDDAAVHGKNP